MKINHTKLRGWLKSGMGSCILSDLARGVAIDYVVDRYDEYGKQVLDVLDDFMKCDAEGLGFPEWIIDIHSTDVFGECVYTSDATDEHATKAWQYARVWMQKNYRREDFYL